MKLLNLTQIQRSKYLHNYRPLIEKQKENKRAICFYIIVALIIPTLLILLILFLTIQKRKGKILLESDSIQNIII